MDKFYIPQHLDVPFKLILWTWDEFLSFVAPFFICLMIMNAPMTGVLIGAGSVFGLKKLKGEEGHYFLLHLLYWHLPPMVRYKVTPPSYVREILG